MNNCFVQILMIIIFPIIISAQTTISTDTLKPQTDTVTIKPKTVVNANTSDTLPILIRKDLNYLSRICNRKFLVHDKVVLCRNKVTDTATRFRYAVLCNDSLLWELTLSNSSDELETIIVRAIHNKTVETSAEQKKIVERGHYQVTPWVTIPPLYKEQGVSERLLNMFAWKSGGTVSFDRQHFYNYRKSAGDTGVAFPNVLTPVIYTPTLTMEYTHRINKILWVGAGIERSWQKSPRFDTLFVDRGRWFARMGWNLHVALPGFEYKLYRDPGVIPFYGQYEDSLYTKLYPGAEYQFLRKLDITIDSQLVDIEAVTQWGEKKDTTIKANRFEPIHGLANDFTVKIGYFNYVMTVYPNAYTAPIHTVGMVEMPFFKGDWGMKLLILPNGRVIPHCNFNFYRTHIPIGKNQLGISPAHLEFAVWDRLGYFASLGFNAEFLTHKATFSKE